MAAERLVRVLDSDPDLGQALDPETFERVRRVAIAREVTIEPGDWCPETSDAAAGGIGLLILDGLLLRDVWLDRSVGAELLGGGDVLRPWDSDVGVAPLGLRVRWRALETTRLAVLDDRFSSIVCRSPELIEALLTRAMRRAASLAFCVALGNIRRVDTRLRILFWHLTERWGRVGTDGIVLPLPLTHETLAHLVAAQRPSVTTALGELSRRGEITRRADGNWVVSGEHPAELSDGLEPQTEGVVAAA